MTTAESDREKAELHDTFVTHVRRCLRTQCTICRDYYERVQEVKAGQPILFNRGDRG